MVLGIAQPKVSNLLRGKLSEFSTDTLRRYLNALGADVELVVKVRPRAPAIFTSVLLERTWSEEVIGAG